MDSEIKGAITEDKAETVTPPTCGWCHTQEPVIETTMQPIQGGFIQTLTYCSHCGGILGVSIIPIRMPQKKNKIVTIN